MMLFCAIFCVQTDLLAQSITPTKLKTEQGGLKRRKHHEKDRKRKSRGNLKRKSKGLQKVYYKKKSNQAKNVGTYWVDPRPKDFTAIKERVEKNPSRKKLKTQKTRKSYFRASSNQRHKSYGGKVVLKPNTKLDYKYASKSSLLSKGKNKIQVPKKNYRKTSRQNQKHSGKIILQPEAKKTDFNEIKARVERSPGRSKARRINQQKSRTAANASLSQNYRGSVNTKGRNANKKAYKYGSKVHQKSTGNLKASNVKSSKNQGKNNSASMAQSVGGIKVYSRKRQSKPSNAPKHKGYVKTTNKNYRNQGVKGKSLNQSQYKGNLKLDSSGGLKVNNKNRQGKASNGTQHKGFVKAIKPKYRNQELGGKSMNQSQYSGNFRLDSKSKQNTSRKLAASYSGNLKANSKKTKNQMLRSKSSSFTSAEGNIKVLSKRKQDKLMSKNSKTSRNYAGNIVALQPKHRRQALGGKSMNMSQYQGEIKTRKQGKAAAGQPKTNLNVAAYQGNLVILSRDRNKQEYKYRSKVQHNHKGNVNQKKYVKWADSRKSHSNLMSNFQGNVRVVGKKEQQFEHMSKTAHNHSGNDRIKKQYARNKYFSNVSDRNLQIIGNYRVKTGLVKDIEQQITSAKVHNYQGGPKVGWFSRMWLNLFDNTGKLDKMNGKVKKLDYDSREYKIWN